MIIYLLNKMRTAFSLKPPRHVKAAVRGEGSGDVPYTPIKHGGVGSKYITTTP